MGWNTKFEVFLEQNKGPLNKLDSTNDIKTLIDIYTLVAKECFCACEEYDSQNEEELEEERCGDDNNFSMYYVRKLENLILETNIVTILNDDWGWFPYDNYYIDENGDIIFFTPMHLSDGTFTGNVDKYSITLRGNVGEWGITFRDYKTLEKNTDGSFNYKKEEVDYFKEIINNILEMYKNVDEQLKHD